MCIGGKRVNLFACKTAALSMYTCIVRIYVVVRVIRTYTYDDDDDAAAVEILISYR